MHHGKESNVTTSYRESADEKKRNTEKGMITNLALVCLTDKYRNYFTVYSPFSMCSSPEGMNSRQNEEKRKKRSQANDFCGIKHVHVTRVCVKCPN